MFATDLILFWHDHFARPKWDDYELSQFGINPKKPRSRGKERWSRNSRRRREAGRESKIRGQNYEPKFR